MENDQKSSNQQSDDFLQNQQSSQEKPILIKIIGILMILWGATGAIISAGAVFVALTVNLSPLLQWGGFCAVISCILLIISGSLLIGYKKLVFYTFAIQIVFELIQVILLIILEQKDTSYFSIILEPLIYIAVFVIVLSQRKYLR